MSLVKTIAPTFPMMIAGLLIVAVAILIEIEAWKAHRRQSQAPADPFLDLAPEGVRIRMVSSPMLRCAVRAFLGIASLLAAGDAAFFLSYGVH